MIKLLLAIIFIFMISQAQFSASFRVNVPVPPPPPIPPSGFMILFSDDDDMNRPDLMVISPSQVGFWVQTPSGRYVLHCRSMRYDRDLGEWYYGPWHEDYNMSYNRYRHSSFYNRNFKDYMKKSYPKYYDKRFNHENRGEWKEEKRRDDRPEWKEEKRHDDRRNQDNKNWRKHDKDDRDREHR